MFGHIDIHKNSDLIQKGFRIDSDWVQISFALIELNLNPTWNLSESNLNTFWIQFEHKEWINGWNIVQICVVAVGFLCVIVSIFAIRRNVVRERCRAHESSGFRRWWDWRRSTFVCKVRVCPQCISQTIGCFWKASDDMHLRSRSVQCRTSAARVTHLSRKSAEGERR